MHVSSLVADVPRPAKHVASVPQASCGGVAAVSHDVAWTETGKIAAAADVASGDVGLDGSV